VVETLKVWGIKSRRKKPSKKLWSAANLRTKGSKTSRGSPPTEREIRENVGALRKSAEKGNLTVARVEERVVQATTQKKS